MAEIRKPYCDWKTAMSRENSDFRYRCMTGLASDEELAAVGMTQEDCCEFDRARAAIVRRVVEKIDAGEIAPVELTRKTGWSKALISNIRAGRKDFGMPIYVWEALSYDVMLTSVHEFITGEEKPLVLPMKYSIPAAVMQKNMKEADIRKLKSVSKLFVKDYYAEGVYEGGHHRPVAELIRERMGEIREHFGYPYYQTFGVKYDGAETPNMLKSGLADFWNPKSTRALKFSILVYAALYYPEQNLDYIVAEDPLRGFCEVYVKDENGENIPLTGSNREFWRNVLILDDKRKKRLMEMAWANGLSALLG